MKTNREGGTVRGRENAWKLDTERLRCNRRAGKEKCENYNKVKQQHKNTPLNIHWKPEETWQPN